MKISADAILYEDNHLLVVNKPSGLATMGSREGEASLAQAAQQYLKEKYAKPGNVYLGIVSRLDRLVSGVIVLARTSKAAARLNEQFRGRSVVKEYWAIVAPAPRIDQQPLEDWLMKDERLQRMVVTRSQHPDAQVARLAFHVAARHGQYALLRVQLDTGRKHQIRVQLAHRGWPVVGDQKYGSREIFPGGIALHSRRLEFEHPVRRELLVCEAPLPASWQRFRRQHGWAEPWLPK